MTPMKQVLAQIFSVAFGFVLALVVVTSTVSAQSTGLTLQSIGTVVVNGTQLSQWQYTGVNPVFTGTATPSAAVTVTIAGVAGNTTANSTGAWTFTPTNLTSAGTYSVSITSGASTLNFSLLINTSAATATPSATADTKGGVTASGSALPVSGGLEDTLLLSAFGLGLIGVAFLFIANLRRQPVEA